MCGNAHLAFLRVCSDFCIAAVDTKMFICENNQQDAHFYSNLTILNVSLRLADRASFSNSFYFFTNLIHLVFFTILAYLSLHVSDQSVHHQEDQMLSYTSSF